METKLSPLIDANDLLNLANTPNLVLIDASNGKDAQENYSRRHLDKALFIELNSQLADIKSDFANGGRHPLPDISSFAKLLQEKGIDKNSHIVVYDDKNGSNAAARFWWMLRAIGHQKVQVLNGGFQQAEKIGFPVNDNAETAKSVGSYEFSNWKLPMAEIYDVEESSKNGSHLIVDVRESLRYRGEAEPIDLVAGHIPGSVNVPFSENLDESGNFLTADRLKTKYQSVFSGFEPENTIIHCGSGVTACHTLLAIDYAGLPIPKLYVGSWSEWSRNDKPIAKEVD